VYERVTGVGSLQVLPTGRVVLHVLKLTVSPKNRFNTCAPAPPSTLCPESYSGVGGASTNGIHVGSALVSALPSVAASRMAVIGRQ